MSNNFEVWKNHFIRQAKGLIPHEKQFYQVTTEKGDSEKIKNDHNVTLVSPMQEVVERAKTNINNPIPTYDPVTGVVRHLARKPRSIRKSTTKNKKKKKNQGKKKKKSSKTKGKFGKKKLNYKKKK